MPRNHNPQQAEVEKLTDDEFDARFDPIDNHIDDSRGWGGCMFETYDEELEYVLKIHAKSPGRVFTILEGDNDTWVIVNGFRVVNRIGYLIGKKAVPKGTNIEVTIQWSRNEET